MRNSQQPGVEEQVANRRILVTGASGFIGAHLCLRLQSCGAKINAVSSEARLSSGEQIRWWQADLADPQAVRQLVDQSRPDIVFHLASRVTGARSVKEVLPTFYGNLASTVHLFTALAEFGCQRVVVAGSSEEPLTFESSTVPCSPYAAAKWAGSMYSRMFHQLFELPVVIPRIFMTYGPDQKDGTKLVPFVIDRLLRNDSPELSSGRRLADWIYVDDVVEGLLRSATTVGIEGSSFDLGTGRLTSVHDVVDEIVRITGTSVRPAFGTLPDRPLEQERAADTTFLSSRLGYTPGTSLEDGLASTVRWYQRQQCLKRTNTAVDLARA